MNGNIVIANLIWLFHVLVVAFVIIVPFLDTPYLHILHLAFGTSLLVHWYGNSNVCSLSVMEAKFRGLHYTQSFTHQFIAPVYEVSSTDWSKICYMTTIVLMLLSFYKLVTSLKFADAWRCLQEKKKSIIMSHMSFQEKVMEYARCFRPIFEYP